MDFQLLGPIAVSDGKGPLALAGPKPRVLLAHLVLELNRLVPTERLIAAVWGDDAPVTARNSLQSYASRLRKELGSERLEGRTGGYVLHGEEDEVDVLRFERLVERARASEDPAAAARTYREALALWRGPALDDLADQPSLRAEIARLEELRLAAIEERVDAELTLGRHGEVVPELQRLTAQHRLRERLWGQLMVALYRSGRQGEALAAFQRARDLLAEELGIDPSSELQRLHQQVLRQDLALEVVGTPLRGYRLLEEIGAGGVGVVHRGFHPQMGREVAIKAIHPRLANDPRFIRRFDAEAQLVARLEHPHLVPLYDYWREPGGAYLVMRYLGGGSLRDQLADGPEELSTVVRVVEHVGQGLRVAHDRGVVHGDVKPENILLDEAGNAYLSDFAIAKDLADTAGTGRSTPSDLVSYLSPEEAHGEPATASSDVYSLGLVIFEMLAGRHPYAAVPSQRLERARVGEPVPSLRALRPELPEQVDAVIARATAKAPEERFGDPLALVTGLRDALATEPTPQVATSAEVRNPYKGLRAFGEADAGDFFGRERLVERLIARLAEPGETARFLAVVGPSGSGKSSLVRAGLVPSLRAGAVAGSEGWFVVEMLPGTDPFAEFRAALRGVAARPLPANLADQLGEDADALGRAASWVLPEDDGQLLLVVDQFEELFTLVDDGRREAFLDALVSAVGDGSGPVRAVATLRADFYDRPLAHAGLAELLRARTEVITPLRPEELERAILAPAEHVGVAVQPGLIAEVVADVADEPGTLPLLQHALTELFDRRHGAGLTLEAYREVGKIFGALARRAEEVHGALDGQGQAAARQLFLRLVTLGDGPGAPRRGVARGELLSLLDEPEAMTAAIDAFGDARLVSFDRDPATREPTVEVAHEALLLAWGRLRDWIDTARDRLRTQRRLVTATREWLAVDREPSYLAAGSRLEAFEALAADGEVALTLDEQAFIDAALAERDRLVAEGAARRAHERALERRSLRRLRALVAVLGIAAVVATGLTFLALHQTDRLAEQVRIAIARELAAAAVADLDVDPERAILLALEAVDTTREADSTLLPEAEEALRRAVGAFRGVDTVPHGRRALAVSADGSRVAIAAQDDAIIWDLGTGQQVLALDGHGGDVNGVAFHPDGHLLATTGDDATVRIWDAHSGEERRVLYGHHAWVLGVAFSSDGERLVTTGADGTVRIWAVGDGAAELVLEGHEGVTLDAAFSPDGTLVASTGSDTTVRLWNASTGEEGVVLTGHEFPVFGLAFSPDGNRVATASHDASARIWDLRSGEEILHVTALVPLNAVAFDPEGTRVATGGSDGSAHVWDAETGAEAIALAGHKADVTAVAFTPDATTLLTTSLDGTTRRWDVTVGGARDWLTVPGAERIYTGVTFSPDGASFAAPAEPNGVTVWDSETGAEIVTLGGHDAKLTSVAFSPDGRTIAAGSDVTDAPPVWDVETGELRFTLEGHEGSARPVTFSPDGRLLVTGDDGGTVRLWDASTGERRDALGVPDGWVADVAVDPGSRLLAAGSSDGTATVWDLETLERLHVLQGHTGMVFGVDLAADGRLLTASLDGTAQIWDVATGEKLVTLRGHDAPVNQATFDADGTRIATASDDGAARLWDPATGETSLTLRGHTRLVYGVAFSPDGRLLATASPDGTVALHLLPTQEFVALARGRVTRQLTDDECRRYLPAERCPP